MVRVNFPVETLDIGFNQHGMGTKAVKTMVEMMKDPWKAHDTKSFLTEMLQTISLLGIQSQGNILIICR